MRLKEEEALKKFIKKPTRNLYEMIKDYDLVYELNNLGYSEPYEILEETAAEAAYEGYNDIVFSLLNIDGVGDVGLIVNSAIYGNNYNLIQKIFQKYSEYISKEDINLFAGTAAYKDNLSLFKFMVSLGADDIDYIISEAKNGIQDNDNKGVVLNFIMQSTK